MINENNLEGEIILLKFEYVLKNIVVYLCIIIFNLFYNYIL